MHTSNGEKKGRGICILQVPSAEDFLLSRINVIIGPKYTCYSLLYSAYIVVKCRPDGMYMYAQCYTMQTLTYSSA